MADLTANGDVIFDFRFAIFDLKSQISKRVFIRFQSQIKNQKSKIL
jgi:hypothetical protein